MSKEITLYYANWCGHCKRFKPVWNSIKPILKANNVKVSEYEQEENLETTGGYAKEAAIAAYADVQRGALNGCIADYIAACSVVHGVVVCKQWYALLVLSAHFAAHILLYCSA